MEQNRATIQLQIAAVEDIIGRIGDQQHGLLAECLAESEQGVMDLAVECANSQFARNPPAVFVSALRKGKHHRGLQARSRGPRTYAPQLGLSEPEKERHKVMARDWRRIQQAISENRDLAELFRAMQDECADPRNPTDEEGERTRHAMLYAIDHASELFAQETS